MRRIHVEKKKVMIKIGIIGGAGYTAGELIRILLHHPAAQIVFVHSNSNSNKPIHTVHTDLLGETDIYFSSIWTIDIDVLFLCTGHDTSKKFLRENPFPSSVKIIDLSKDFRLKADADGFVYGLPELNKSAIQTASKIANPGCFATAIQLAVLPLAHQKWITDDLHVHGITGSTGAGQSPEPTTHFSWRNNNLSIYKAFTHQHLEEVNQSVMQLQPNIQKNINFLPLRGNFSRGILVSVYMNTDKDWGALKNCYESFYQNAPFVVFASSHPDLKQVINTNKCVLYVEKIDGKVLITSLIDNLLKGASGQAVQNMNLMFGLDETLGLKLKAVAF